VKRLSVAIFHAEFFPKITYALQLDVLDLLLERYQPTQISTQVAAGECFGITQCPYFYVIFDCLGGMQTVDNSHDTSLIVHLQSKYRKLHKILCN
jgi:hypothetical protein